MSAILFPDDIRDEAAVGGKARALAELTLAGLPVPDWFVVTSGAFKAGELATAVEALGGDGQAVFAVRSSAVEEDSARRSFAGQLESYLRVPHGEVAARVADVWRSGSSERLASYRRSMGAGPLTGAPAVIVQRMVEGEVSGVAFSADPVSARRGVAVVAAVRGLANTLVSGEADADTWHVDRDGNIFERKLCAPTPVLNDAMVIAVAALARRAERHFGRPQDIEWTAAGDRLYLLQSRPITTLAGRPDPDGVRALWDNSNIIESYGGITTPLTFSFARRAYEHVYREFCRLIRMPQAAIEAHGAMFCCMLGLFRGRVYYNLYNWYRLVAVLPGYRFNRRFMEQMMGVRESLPEDVAAAQARPARGARLRDAWRLAVSMGAFALHLATLPRRMARFQRRLAETLGPARPDLGGLRPDELVAYYRSLEARLLVHWDAPIVNDFATMIDHGLLRRLCAAWIPDDKGTLHNDLLCAEPGMVSEEPARRVAEMAGAAAQDATLVEVLREGTLPAIRKALARHPGLADAIAQYLERFGERCMEELKLESPTLHDDPTPLYRAIGHYAANLASRAGREQARNDLAVRHAAEARVRSALARRPFARLAFGWVLKRARASLRARENLRFERTRVFGRARQIVLELGKRLAAVECLEEPRDVFYLEIDELLAYVEARATTTDLKGLVAVRKREFAAWRDAAAPAERFETRGLAYRGHAFAAAMPAPAPQGERLQGLACCPGIVRGPVRIVRDARGASIRRGEIVVAERTDPGWVMIFPGAAGLLVERGSLLSHSAIVARELGLPAIVSLPGLTSWLKDGELVEMDGSTGTVVKLAGADGQTEPLAA